MKWLNKTQSQERKGLLWPINPGVIEVGGESLHKVHYFSVPGGILIKLILSESVELGSDIVEINKWKCKKLSHPLVKFPLNEWMNEKWIKVDNFFSPILCVGSDHAVNSLNQSLKKWSATSSWYCQVETYLSKVEVTSTDLKTWKSLRII